MLDEGNWGAMVKDGVRSLIVWSWQNLPLEILSGKDRKVPDPVNSATVSAQKRGLQKSLARMVLEQSSITDIAKQHLDLFLARHLLHFGQ